MTTVVYAALGGRRVTAAVQHVDDLVAGGVHVVLLIADRPEWTGCSFPPSVTVHKLSPRSARRYLLDSPDVDLLIAGDPEAMAVAFRVGRRRPDLAIQFEPSPDPSRRTAPADLAVITPWYPSPDDPFAGAFVQATTAAVGAGRVSVLHTQNWYYSPQGVAGQVVGVGAERQAAKSGHAVVLDTPEGELTRVAVPTAAGRGYPAYAEAQVEALRASLPTGRIEAPLVHAHTGMLAGIVATRLARPDARLIVTEHATFLPAVFEQPGARAQYAEMLNRADALLCVGRYLFDQLSGYFPEYAHKLRIVPNAIDFDRFAVRAETPRELLRWLYVGRLMEHKGVLTLVDGFARIAAEDPRVTLSLVGSGPVEDELDARIAELGLGDRITRCPAVPPDEVAGLLHEHDLLVHASRMETFGMTVVEAIATGTPVLVARSPGPEETMAGLDGLAGLLIEPSTDPSVIAEGYRSLRSRLPELDLPGARAVLEGRYGFEAVAAQFRAVHPSAPEQLSLPERARRVVVVNGTPRRADRARALADQFVRDGLGVDLITADPWAHPAPGVKIHDLSRVDNRWLARFLLLTLPGEPLRIAQRPMTAFTAPGPEAVVRFLRRAHQRIAGAIQQKILLRAHNIVRSRALWRLARREAVPHLDLTRVTEVVVVDPYGVTIGWQLGRKCPNVPVRLTR